jgi:hypothetical protein
MIIEHSINHPSGATDGLCSPYAHPKLFSSTTSQVAPLSSLRPEGCSQNDDVGSTAHSKMRAEMKGYDEPASGFGSGNLTRLLIGQKSFVLCGGHQ